MEKEKSGLGKDKEDKKRRERRREEKKEKNQRKVRREYKKLPPSQKSREQPLKIICSPESTCSLVKDMCHQGLQNLPITSHHHVSAAQAPQPMVGEDTTVGFPPGHQPP
ncbi:hypothetical protein EVAR_63569_1 [Eumeta japonica]|uniref:Uncharacterized protein n=1 Tax=Eumeta variegata TaxID=151549 RepID=A0A4C2A3A7_EUMVA|nr:hypothetical protein EVAR_63569_1 [Eumeta japonica]